MDRKYRTLSALLQAEPAAREYFDQLPEYARQQISQREEGVNSFASLRDYAENLLRGDD